MFRSRLRAVFLVALVLRVGIVLATIGLPIGLDDMFQYDMLARSIVTGNGYRWYAEEDLPMILRAVGDVELPPDYDPHGIRTSFRAPLYPAFLVLIYTLVGVTPGRLLAVRLGQAFVGAAMAPLCVLLGQRMGLGERAAVWGGWIVALYPLLAIYPLGLATENLYIPLLTVALWALLLAGDSGRARDFVLAGVLLGLTALTRSVVSLFVPLAAAWIWLTTLPRRAGLRNAVILALCFAAVVVPWSVRNTLLHGRLTLIETSLGYNLYMGYHPESSGTFDARISSDLIPILDDGERDRLGVEAFISFVRDDPGRVPLLMANKFAYFWGLDKRVLVYFYANNYVGHWPAWLLASAFILVCGPLVFVAPAGLAGMVLSRRREMALVVLFLVYYVGIHMLILAEPRFHIPLIPVLAPWAAHLVIEEPWRGASRWQRVLAVSLVLLLLGVWGRELTQDWQMLTDLFGPEGHRLWLSY